MLLLVDRCFTNRVISFLHLLYNSSFFFFSRNSKAHYFVMTYTVLFNRHNYILFICLCKFKNLTIDIFCFAFKNIISFRIVYLIIINKMDLYLTKAFLRLNVVLKTRYLAFLWKINITYLNYSDWMIQKRRI